MPRKKSTPPPVATPKDEEKEFAEAVEELLDALASENEPEEAREARKKGWMQLLHHFEQAPVEPAPPARRSSRRQPKPQQVPNAEDAATGEQPQPPTKGRRAKKRLLYNISPNNGGLVFAEPERARLVSRIYQAIYGSSTWAELRRAMPRAEYSEIIQSAVDNKGRSPRGSDRFDVTQVPGFCDGVYPPWLQQEMGDVLPRDILDDFGAWQNTMISGSFALIDPKHLPAIKARLEQLGYFVEDGTALSFH